MGRTVDLSHASKYTTERFSSTMVYPALIQRNRTGDSTATKDMIRQRNEIREIRTKLDTVYSRMAYAPDYEKPDLKRQAVVLRAELRRAEKKLGQAHRDANGGPEDKTLLVEPATSYEADEGEEFKAKDGRTKPELWSRTVAQVKASSKGGKPGQWSARKAQLAGQIYRSKGGGYTKKKTAAQKSMSKWTKQKWRTSDGKDAIRKGGTARYLPDKAWDKLSPAEKAATNAKKRRASKQGKQFVPNTDKAAKARKEAMSVEEFARSAKAQKRRRMSPRSLGRRDPSLRWPHLYDILRAKGYSKEKAARISNARRFTRKKGRLVVKEGPKFETTTEEFHGNHDQSTHGRRGRGTGANPAAISQIRVQLLKRIPVDTPGLPPDSENKHKDADGNWTPARKKVHERIINDLLDGVEPPADGQPTLYTMGGGGGAGKGYVQSKGYVKLPSKKEAAHLNPDDIKEMLPEYPKLVGAKDKGAAAFMHEESSYINKEAQRIARERGLNIVLDQVGSNPAKMVSQLEQARSLGYKTEAHYVTVPVDTAVRRAQERGERSGRFVPESVLRDAHRGATQTFQTLARSGLLDNFSLVDNGGSEPRVLARGQGTQLDIVDQAGYDVFVTRGD